MSEAAIETPGPPLAPSLPEDLPSSARQIYKLLAIEGPLTHKELVELSGMPARTVRYAVSRLKEDDHVGERRNLMDCRQRFFFIDGGSDEDDSAGQLTKL